MCDKKYEYRMAETAKANWNSEDWDFPALEEMMMAEFCSGLISFSENTKQKVVSLKNNLVIPGASPIKEIPS